VNDVMCRRSAAAAATAASQRHNSLDAGCCCKAQKPGASAHPVVGLGRISFAPVDLKY